MGLQHGFAFSGESGQPLGGVPSLLPKESNLKILIVPEAASTGRYRSADKGRLFESFVRDIVLLHTHIERIEFAPKDADIWAYDIVGQTPIMVECKATAEPVKKEAVAAFYGDYALRRLKEKNVVAILMSTGGFTGETIDSALGYFQQIKDANHDEAFHLYDSQKMLELLAKQDKIRSSQQIAVVLERAPELGVPLDWNFLVTPRGRFWLVEFDDNQGQNPYFLLLDEFGSLADAREIARLPWTALTEIKPDVSVDLVRNASMRTPLLSRPTTETKPSGVSKKLSNRLARSGRLHSRVEALVASAVRISCDERAESLCTVTERLAVTYLDQLVTPELLDGLDDEQASAMIAAQRLVSAYHSCSLIHSGRHFALGEIGDFIRVAAQSIPRREEWTSEVTTQATAIIQAVISLASSSANDSQPLLPMLGALAVHFATAFGPLSGIYKSAVLDSTSVDDAMVLVAGVPRLQDLWVDEQTQVLRLAIEAPTPRSHRYLLGNQNYMQDVIERAEDRADQEGSRLPFTRVRVSVTSVGFETIECYFELENEHVLKIFMGEELYGNKDVWIREVLQNAIDATMLRKILSDDDSYIPKIAISYDARSKKVEIGDNGIGMSLHQVRKFFSKIGRSYYRSFELEEELRRKNKSFNAISRFGVGFLSVFMVADSVEITTASAIDEDADSLAIFIPALMEDFYVRRTPRKRTGTTITLHLRDGLKRPLHELFAEWVVNTDVYTTVIEDGRPTAYEVNRELHVLPNVVKPGSWQRSFDTLSVKMTSRDYEAAICVPIPRRDSKVTDRRFDEAWQQLPPTRIVLAQAGISVKDQNDLFGESRGPLEAHHSYFHRVYGLVNYRPGALKMSVSRKEFVLDKEASEVIRLELLNQTTQALARRIDEEVRAMTSSADINRYIGAILFGAIADGQQYYHTAPRLSLANYDYSNSRLLDEVAANLYAKHFNITIHDPKGRAVGTIAQISADARSWGPCYFTLDKDIDKNSLFSAWLGDQPAKARVFVVKSKREAVLLLRALAKLNYREALHEVTPELMQEAIKYDVVPGPLDNFLRAACGIVRFGKYKPSTAMLVVSAKSPGVVSKAVGLTTTRAACSDSPFVLLDSSHWLTQLLTSAALVSEDPQISECLREISDLLMTIALGSGVTVQKEAVQVANGWLSKLYSLMHGKQKVGDLSAVKERPMIVLADLIGPKRSR